MKKIAFIPARSGSKRVPDKNIRSLAGHPLMSYTIRAAIESQIFDDVLCITDSEKYADIARHYGASVPFLRPKSISGDKSPDIDWLKWVLKELNDLGQVYEVFSILRPTSPFRLPETIQRAWMEFASAEGIDSLRAIEKCKQHPGKMWIVRGSTMLPFIPLSENGVPWHSSQYSSLPEVYIQNASLEIAYTKTIYEKNSIAGDINIPFYTRNMEGFDINEEVDWDLAELYIQRQEAELVDIELVEYDKY